MPTKQTGRKKRQPKPSKGKNLSKTQKVNLAKKVCTLYAEGEENLKSCLAKAGIKSFSTWHKWKGEIEEIETLYEDAIELREESYEVEAVESSKSMLLRWVNGFTYTETKTETLTDSEGEELEVLKVTKTEKTKHSLNAAIHILSHLHKGKFKKTTITAEDLKDIDGFKIVIGPGDEG